jgi:hypothetical protein
MAGAGLAYGVDTSKIGEAERRRGNGGNVGFGARLYLLLSNQLHYRCIQFSGSEWIVHSV